MKKLCLFTIAILCSLYPLRAINSEECFALTDCFRSSQADIERAMDDYVLAVKADPSGPMNKLALAILCVALDSQKDSGPAVHSKEAIGYTEEF